MVAEIRGGILPPFPSPFSENTDSLTIVCVLFQLTPAMIGSSSPRLKELEVACSHMTIT